MKNRYLFCWNGEQDGGIEAPYDCACCITWSDDELYQRCGCICHERIEEMSRVRHIQLFLLAAEAMGEMPKFFSSYAEKLTHSKSVTIEHAQKTSDSEWDNFCTCEFCEFARNDLKVRKFAIEGEDNSHIEDADVRSGDESATV